MSPTPPVYNPINQLVFKAAFSGALAGQGANGRQPNFISRSSPFCVDLAEVAGAYAQSFDTAWAASPTSAFDLETIAQISSAVWAGRAPSIGIPSNLVPGSYTPLVLALIAIVQSGDDYLDGNGLPTISAVPSSPYEVPVGTDALGREVFLAVQDVGTPTNGTVVIIPGTNCDASVYQYQTAFLVQEGYRVVTITQRGQGDSSQPYDVYSLDQFADDINAALNIIKPTITNATMLAHSFGTGMAIHYAVKYKNAHIAKLALTGMIPTFNGSIPAPEFAEFIGLIQVDYPYFIGEVFTPTIYSGGTAPIVPLGGTEPSPDTESDSTTTFLKTPNFIDIELFTVLQNGLAPLGTDLPKVNIPTLFIAGENDALTPPALAEYAASVIPTAIQPVTILPATGHMCFYMNSIAFNEALLAFIA